MTTPDPLIVPVTTAVKSIGSIAARKRRQLEQFEAERQKSLEELNQQRAQLKKELEEIEARERRRVRKQQTEVQHQLKLALGGLVLGVLQTHGTHSFTITSQDLKQLQEKDQLRLAEMLGVMLEHKTNSDPVIKPGAAGADGTVDIVL